MCHFFRFIDAGKKGEYTGHARAKKELQNVMKRDNATNVCSDMPFSNAERSRSNCCCCVCELQVLTKCLESIEASAGRWAKMLTAATREARDEFETVSDSLRGLLTELTER